MGNRGRANEVSEESWNGRCWRCGSKDVTKLEERETETLYRCNNYGDCGRTTKVIKAATPA